MLLDLLQPLIYLAFLAMILFALGILIPTHLQILWWMAAGAVVLMVPTLFLSAHTVLVRDKAAEDEEGAP